VKTRKRPLRTQVSSETGWPFSRMASARDDFFTTTDLVNNVCDALLRFPEGFQVWREHSSGLNGNRCVSAQGGSGVSDDVRQLVVRLHSLRKR